MECPRHLPRGVHFPQEKSVLVYLPFPIFVETFSLRLFTSSPGKGFRSRDNALRKLQKTSDSMQKKKNLFFFLAHLPLFLISFFNAQNINVL